jgi:integrase
VAKLVDARHKYLWHYGQLHDFLLLMANTGLRPDEAYRLEYRDVTVTKDDATGETILVIAVRGKRGVGFCKSMPAAVHPFQRLKKRNSGRPTDRLFPLDHRELFNTILEEEDLKFDREGQRRSSYSLRHTYICLRIMEGANVWQVAKNCRTSVEMIEKYYASHIPNSIDAESLNVIKKKSSKKRVEEAKVGELVD